MMRHVTSLLVNVVLVDYILPEFCHCLIFLFKKIGAGFYSPTPNIIEPIKKERLENALPIRSFLFIIFLQLKDRYDSGLYYIQHVVLIEVHFDGLTLPTY